MIRIITIIVIFFPFLLFSENNITFNNSLNWKSNFETVSNSIKNKYINQFLFSGEITSDIKNEWINNSLDQNIYNIEFSNQLYYSNSKYKFSLKLKDRNIINSSFDRDFLKLLLFGNLNYQNEKLSINNTNFRANRFQQFEFEYKFNTRNVNFNIALSYLNGNQHYSCIVNNGSVYTSSFGTYIDLNYDLQYQFTDFDNFTFFSNNGNGFALCFDFKYIFEDKTVQIYIDDLGYINWNNNTKVGKIDSNFTFNGYEIDNILNINDTIFNEFNDYYREKSSKFKSYIPANFGLFLNKKINYHYLYLFEVGLNFKWQPLLDNTPLTFNKIKQGIHESNYLPLIWFSSSSKFKYFDSKIDFSIGGYSNKPSLGIELSRGIKTKFIIGSQHVNQMIKSHNSLALSLYFSIQRNF